jgi:mycothiol synthase
MVLPPHVGLPDGFTARPPRRDEAPELAEILAACERANSGSSTMSVDEFLGDWEGANLETDAIAIIDPDDRPVAYADIDLRGNVIVNVYGYVHPSSRGVGLGAYLVAWGENHAARMAAAASPEARLVARHYINEKDRSALALFDARGYERVRITHTMQIDLDEPPLAPEWPLGLTARQFIVGVDEEATHEAYEEAFADLWQRPRGTFDQFLSKTRRPYFDPSLWTLAMDDDQIAGVLLADNIEGRGWVEVVGVRRPWRKQGLALAMLHHAFGEFYKIGVTHIGLSVDAQSPTGATRVYERAGMRLDETYSLLERELRPGQ